MDKRENRILEDFFHEFENGFTFKGNHDYITSEALGFLTNLDVFRMTTYLDLSFARLHFDLRPLDKLNSLQILVLDNCALTDDHQLPQLSALKTLSLNKNCLKDLELLLERLKPNQFTLDHLSLLGNPLCPHPINNTTDENSKAYERYRARIIFRLQHLKFLDCLPITIDEKQLSYMTGHITLTHTVLSTKRISNVGEKTIAIRREDPNSSDNFKIFYPGPDAVDSNQIPPAKPKGTLYGKLRYRYSGKNSEGNRFIKDKDL